MPVRTLAPADRAEWLRMRRALWPETALEEEREADEWLARPDATVLVFARPEGGLGGFAEVGTRSVADGCTSSPVAYLEGWWVDEDLRRRGVGRALVDAAERWAAERGLTEFASDTQQTNTISQQAHERLGFHEVERAVLYVKRVGRGGEEARER